MQKQSPCFDNFPNVSGAFYIYPRYFIVFLACYIFMFLSSFFDVILQIQSTTHNAQHTTHNTQHTHSHETHTQTQHTTHTTTLRENSGSDVELLLTKSRLDLSLVARLDVHSAPRTHRDKERFPDMTLTFSLIQENEKIVERSSTKLV